MTIALRASRIVFKWEASKFIVSDMMLPARYCSACLGASSILKSRVPPFWEMKIKKINIHSEANREKRLSLIIAGLNPFPSLRPIAVIPGLNPFPSLRLIAVIAGLIRNLLIHAFHHCVLMKSLLDKGT